MGGREMKTGLTIPKNQVLPRVRRLAEICRGKRVAVVGSGTPGRDCSAEIDACDVVIRMNHFYNVPSGRVGTKTDVVVITPSDAWLALSGDERGEKIIKDQKPLILAVRYPERLCASEVREFFKGCEFGRDDETPASVQRFTTGTIVLAKIAEHAENCEIKCFGFSPRDEFIEYLRKDGPHYLGGAEAEACAREVYFEVLRRKEIFDETSELSFRVVIPARKGSSVKDKNVREWKNTGKTLLQIAVEKAREAFDTAPVVLTDSEKYAALAKSYGAEVPYLDDETGGLENVAMKLRRWQERSGFNGWILIQQCTSPEIFVESLRKFRDEALSLGIRRDTAVLSAIAVRKKCTAFFTADEYGNAVQMFSAIAPSVPRQSIPQTWWFNGAAALVHSDSLDSDVLFSGMKFRLVELSSGEAVDIDSNEDFLS
jgi:CMP-N-acetylneuraminic acid synthetase